MVPDSLFDSHETSPKRIIQFASSLQTMAIKKRVEPKGHSCSLVHMQAHARRHIYTHTHRKKKERKKEKKKKKRNMLIMVWVGARQFVDQM